MQNNESVGDIGVDNSDTQQNTTEQSIRQVTDFSIDLQEIENLGEQSPAASFQEIQHKIFIAITHLSQRASSPTPPSDERDQSKENLEEGIFKFFQKTFDVKIKRAKAQNQDQEFVEKINQYREIILEKIQKDSMKNFFSEDFLRIIDINDRLEQWIESADSLLSSIEKNMLSYDDSVIQDTIKVFDDIAQLTQSYSNQEENIFSKKINVARAYLEDLTNCQSSSRNLTSNPDHNNRLKRLQARHQALSPKSSPHSPTSSASSAAGLTGREDQSAFSTSITRAQWLQQANDFLGLSVDQQTSERAIYLLGQYNDPNKKWGKASKAIANSVKGAMDGLEAYVSELERQKSSGNGSIPKAEVQEPQASPQDATGTAQSDVTQVPETPGQWCVRALDILQAAKKGKKIDQQQLQILIKKYLSLDWSTFLRIQEKTRNSWHKNLKKLQSAQADSVDSSKTQSNTHTGDSDAQNLDQLKSETDQQPFPKTSESINSQIPETPEQGQGAGSGLPGTDQHVDASSQPNSQPQPPEKNTNHCPWLRRGLLAFSGFSGAAGGYVAVPALASKEGLGHHNAQLFSHCSAQQLLGMVLGAALMILVAALIYKKCGNYSPA